jgi:uncharacterized membrane protein YqgA involved in biofilm formation
MGWIKKHFTGGVNVALSVSTIMCFVQFVSSIYGAFRTGVFDSSTINNLLSSFDGFESVILFCIMIVLNRRKK